jgi:TolB-like protein/Tfp pilus assembly protein PilF
MSNEASHTYEFGPFLLDPSRRLLLREGKPVSLTAKAFDTLQLLIKNKERIVEKEELLKGIWPDTFVEEATLAQNIFTIRKTLGQTPDGHQYIVTVPKRGYRFVGTVRELQKQPVSVEEGQPPAAGPSGGDEKTKSEQQSLAVMPLVNMSDDPNAEYLCDGITENVINSLSQLHELRVVARSTVFRYKGGEIDPQEVGRELNVTAVLAGRVQLMCEQLIVKAELVDVANGWQLWGEQYARKLSDIFEVQDEIAKHISASLRLRLTTEEQNQLARHHTENAEAYRLYMEGRYHWNKRTDESLKKAIKCFEHAINIDPNYALAYSGLADAYVSFDFHGLLPPWETMPKAKAAARRAIIIDSSLAEAHTSLACVKLIYDRDWATAEKEFKRALELNQNYAHGHNWYSQYLMATGQIEESFKESMIALSLDPFDIGTNLHLGWHYLHAREYDKAIKQLTKVIDLDPHFYLAHLLLGMAYEQRGRFSEALAEFQEARVLEDSPVLLGFLGYTYAALGNKSEAVELLNELQERAKRSYVPPYSMALIYSCLQDQDKAFESLDEAYSDGNQWLTWLKIAPEFDSLRTDPRFATLLRRLNLKN